MNWPLLAASLAGVLALALLARLLGLGRREPLTDGEVRERVLFEFAPFAIRATFLDVHGRAALVAGADGRWIGVKAHGSEPATRVLPVPLRHRREGDELVVETGDRPFGALRLRLDPAQLHKLLTLL